MTRDKIMELDLEAIEVRRSEIATECAEADSETLELLNAELEAIEEREAAINTEIEQRKIAIENIVNDAKGVKVLEKAEERKTEMTDKEIRSSAEYMDAYVEYLKGKATAEQRALLTENVNGMVAVPVYIEDRIHTAWENNELMRLVRKTYFKGNLKVGYEVSASGATFHTEGGEPIAEENLVIDYVTLIPGMVKKMVRVSDEVMDLRGQAFLDYVFDEIEYQIVKGVADSLIDMAAGDIDGVLVVNSTAGGAALTTADIIIAEGKLGPEATNPYLFTTRAAAAALKAAALAANYGYDPFDGLPVIYVPDAVLGDEAMAIIADPSAFQVNLPNGDSVQFKFDDLTEAAADMVRIIGRLYVAAGIVAPGKIVVIEDNK